MPTYVYFWSDREPTVAENVIAFAIQVIITGFAVWVAAELLGDIHLEGFWSTVGVALILGVLNTFVKPLLVLGTLPAVVFTLGFALILINTALLALASWIASWFDAVNFDIDGFWAYFWGAIIISFVSLVLSLIFNPHRIASLVAGGRARQVS